MGDAPASSSLTRALAAAAAAASVAASDDDDDDDDSSFYITDEEEEEEEEQHEGGGKGASPRVAAVKSKPKPKPKSKPKPKGGGPKAAGAGGTKRKAGGGGGAKGEEEKKRTRAEGAAAAAARRRESSASDGGGGRSQHASDFRGVFYDGLCWNARIFFRGTTHLGRYLTEEEAAKAYDEEAKRIWVNPVLNFLPDGSVNPNRHSRTTKMVVRPGMERPAPPKKAAAEKRTSTYRGLVWDRIKWRVQIKSHNKIVSLGRFDTEEEAARAYDTKAKELFVNPVLNFLPDGSLNPDRKAHVLACTYVRKDGSLWKNQPRRLLPPKARGGRKAAMPAGPMVEAPLPPPPPAPFMPTPPPPVPLASLLEQRSSGPSIPPPPPPASAMALSLPDPFLPADAVPALASQDATMQPSSDHSVSSAEAGGSASEESAAAGAGAGAGLQI